MDYHRIINDYLVQRRQPQSDRSSANSRKTQIFMIKHTQHIVTTAAAATQGSFNFMDTFNRVLVKCGGFSSQLARNVTEKVDGDPLWGSRFDCTNPEAVVKTHMDFLRNGADIILSNSYQSSVNGFMRHLGLTYDESIALIAKSVQLAQQAKEQHLREVRESNGIIQSGLPLVMASIGPYGAHLNDGSEYNGNYAKHVSREELQQWHRVRIETCLKAGVDGLAVETIPCQLEALAVAELILTQYKDVKFWVSFQCKNNKELASGESFAGSALSIWQLVQSHQAESRLIAIGVNCVNPCDVSSLFQSLNEITGSSRIPLIVYSNSGELYDATKGEWTGGEMCQPLVSFIPEWLQLGACIVGGCCRVYPSEILQIRKCIDNIDN